MTHSKTFWGATLLGCVFSFWTHLDRAHAALIPIQETILAASDVVTNERFGSSVSLTADGSMALAGAFQHKPLGSVPKGSAYVFVRSGTSWTQQAELTAADGVAWDYFGCSVALSSDGTTALVVASQFNGPGCAYVFVRSGSTWSQQRKLTASDGATYDWFGSSVSLSGDGNTALLGAPGDDTPAGTDAGSAYVFEVFSADFETGVGPEWSTTRTDVTPVGNRRFLGQFGNETVSLTFSNLPPHEEMTISFDLFVIQSWDADGYGGGPDIWDVAVAGGPTLLHTTFSNTEVNNPVQAFPGNFPGSVYPARTGAAEIDALGYGMDCVYQLSFTFPHADDAVAFEFSGQGLQDISDESWGLDNVKVLVLPPNGIVYCPQPTLAVGESESSVAVDVMLHRGTNDPSLEVSVDYQTADDTARAGEDYLAMSGTLTFASGETNKQILIQLLNDTVAESEEQFHLMLSNSSGGVSLGRSDVVIRIEDDDFPFQVDFNENDGGFRVVSTNAPGGPWRWSVASGTWSCYDRNDCGAHLRGSWLTGPVLTVVTPGLLLVAFEHRYSFEADADTRWDGGQFRISVNGGAYTNVPDALFTANGYNNTVDGPGGPDSLILGQRAFTAESAGYAGPSNIQTRLILGPFNSNNTVSIQFLAAWDACAQGQVPNWEIDRVIVAPQSGPPQIITQPISQSVYVGQTVTFQVVAAGTVPLTYQWDFDGALIPDATNNVLVLPSVDLEDAGRYRVRVRNALGETYSDKVSLTVSEVPPDPLLVNPSFEAEPFTIWPGYVSENGPITGWSAVGRVGLNPAPTESLFADNGTIPDGTQVAFIQDDTVLSQVIVGFEVGRPYQIRYSENARNCCSGTVPYLEVRMGGQTLVAAHAVGPVLGSNPYRQVVSDPFMASATQLELAFIKSNPQGGDTTVLIDDVDVVLADGPPSILAEPEDQVALLGGSVVLSVTASGSSPLHYQWDFNGVDIEGATSNILALTSLTSEQAGTYRLRVSNELGSVVSREARLWVGMEIELLPLGSVWKYLDTGVDLGTTWVAPGFDDSAWAAGPAQLGYGDGDEATVVSYGPDAYSKYITTYFRLAFVVPNPNIITNLRAHLIFDDGAIIYLNGIEVVRDNMPYDTVNYLTLASYTVAGEEENRIFEFSVPANQLVAGTNVLAVEIHQSYSSSSDLSFDLALMANAPVGFPQITTQPVSQSVPRRTRATFSISATGASPLTYRWTKDGLNLADDDRISGSQAEVLTIATVQDADAGQYQVAVVNAVGEMLSVPARLSIEEGVVLINFDDVTSPCSFAETTRLTDLYADLGVTFEGPGGQDGAAIVNECNGLSVTGYSPPNFLAFSSSANLQDGGVPRGPETIRFAAAFSRLDLTVGSPAAGTVTVRAYDAAETMVASATVALTTSMTPVQLRGPNMSKVVVSTTAEAFVLDDLRASGPPEGEPPQIVVQPFSQTAVVGETITFSVVATGADPMSYQWDFDGALVPNATNSALLLPNVSLDDAGRYRVRVSNVYGEAFSDNVTLTVSDPADQFLDVWRASDLTTLRDGDTVYSWTSAGYRTVNAGVGLEPEFKQNITPAGGPVVRFNRDFMSTSTSPLGGATAFSIALVFKADAVGANECADWYCKTGLVDAEEYGVTADWGTVITETGQVGIGTGNPDVSTYSTSSPSLVDGNFHVAVFTWGGGMQSVYVDNLWTSSQSGVSTTYRNNAGFAFGGIFADMGGWANQLFVGDMAEIRFYNRALSAAEVGRVISRLTDDHILVDGPPSFLLEPQNQVALLGGSAVFSVMASGSRPVQYQWDFNGVDIAGATNNTLALHGVTVEHAGWYRVRISNDLGSVISRKASLSIRNEIVLVPFGSVWEYLDTGVNLGTTWVAPGFDDSAWASGRAHLGYGDGDEVTVISYGPNPDSKYVTSYFRLAFVVANPNPITNLRLRLIRDDGAIVYLNGVEVVRDNMPSGQVGYLTVASSAVGGTTESQAFEFSVPANQLVSGTNVLAVEIHQNVANSSDLSFDLALLEGLHVGPLQITTQPQPQTVVEGTNVAFTVSASSAIPIRYQWRFNSSPLTDKTNLTLTLTNVQPEDDGFYDVVVSDDVGSVISDPARLTVLLKPRIIQLVTNYTVVQGGNLTLSVQVEGTLPITYVWRRNFFSIRNRQTNDSHQSFFTLTNVQPSEDRANGTYYSVTIANSLSPHAGLNSDRIYLTVLPDSDGDGMDDGWETRYPTATEPDGDADADGLTNKEEYQSGTDPTDPTSYLKVERIAVSGEAQIEFIARANRTYTVEYTEDLDTPAWHKLSDVVAGLENRTVVLTDPAASAQRFYRLVTPRMSNGT